MAGVKGRSGGPRKNAGGARPGAGRKKKEPAVLVLSKIYDDEAEFLRAVMNDSGADLKIRVDAAKALHRARKTGMAGKKAQRAEAAKNAATGRFAPPAPPKLVVSNGK